MPFSLLTCLSHCSHAFLIVSLLMCLPHCSCGFLVAHVASSLLTWLPHCSRAFLIAHMPSSLLTCLPRCWSNVFVEDKNDVSTFPISQVREVSKDSVFQVGRIQTPNQACSQLLHSGGVRSNKVCQFEYWHNFTVCSGVFDICNQLSKWCYALLIDPLSFFLTRSFAFPGPVVQRDKALNMVASSAAMRSPVLNLASRLWSCNCKAHSLTQSARPDVEAWCIDSAACFVSSTLWTEL